MGSRQNSWRHIQRQILRYVKNVESVRQTVQWARFNGRIRQWPMVSVSNVSPVSKNVRCRQNILMIRHFYLISRCWSRTLPDRQRQCLSAKESLVDEPVIFLLWFPDVYKTFLVWNGRIRRNPIHTRIIVTTHEIGNMTNRLFNVWMLTNTVILHIILEVPYWR